MNTKNKMRFFAKLTGIKIETITDKTYSNDFSSKFLQQSDDKSETKRNFSEKSVRHISYKKNNSKYLKSLETEEKFILKSLNKIFSNKNRYKDGFQCEKFDGKFSEEKEECKEIYEETNIKNVNISTKNERLNRKLNDNNNKMVIKFINSNIKYKKMYENLLKENEKLKQENYSLNAQIQKLKDEIDIMRDEDKINKDSILENEEKINQFSKLIQQQINNFDQKIFNYKELLFKKDEEIHRLNKKLEKNNINSKNIINELKIKLKDYEKKIDKENNINNMNNTINDSSHLNVFKKENLNNYYGNNINIINREKSISRNVNSIIKS